MALEPAQHKGNQNGLPAGTSARRQGINCRVSDPEVDCPGRQAASRPHSPPPGKQFSACYLDWPAELGIPTRRIALESSVAKIMAYYSAVFEEGGRNQLLGEVQSRSGTAHDVMPRRHNRPMHQTRKNSKYQRRRAAGTSIASIVPMLSLLCLFAFVGRCSGFVTENLMGSAAPRSIHAKLSAATSSNDKDGGISSLAEEGSTSSSTDEPTSSSDDVPSTPCVRICR